MEEQMEGQIGRVEGQTNWQTEGRMKGEIEIGIAKYEGSAEPTTVAIRHKPIKNNGFKTTEGLEGRTIEGGAPSDGQMETDGWTNGRKT